MYNFRTDLALERRDIYRKANKIDNELDGVETEEEIDTHIRTSRVKILNHAGEEILGKPIGNYITLDIKKLKYATEEEIQKAAEALSKELKVLLEKHATKQDEILVVGLRKRLCYPGFSGTKSN